METRNTYENIHFSGTINVILADSFPQVFPPHWHKYVEIVALPETCNIKRPPALRVNQTAYEINPGDILFIWPGEVHETVENRDHGLIGLQFSATVLKELPDFTPFFNIFRTFHHICHLDMPELSQRMLAHIKQIHSIQQNQGTFSGVETVICLYEMFMDFGNHIQNTILKDVTPYPSGGSGTTIEKIIMACNYITDNCEHEITLESAASYIGFSPCYFSRIFKKVTNYNFVEYLTLQRIKRAQMLLSDSDIAITELSYQSGFKSISTFNRVFRQYRGCSPSEYRKYYLK